VSAKNNLPNPMAITIVKHLRQKKMTLAVAESITGGLLAACITDVSGSSKVFAGGIISYTDEIKTKFLGIPKRTLTKHTAVSEVVVIAMAESARTLFKTDYAIATTGVAGPGRAYQQKVGTVWVAIASKNPTISLELALSGDRAEIRHASIESALAAFARILTQ
jgi:nicotinamide-nucleotide amidase